MGKRFATRVNFVPKRRDIVFLEWDSAAGDETPGMHPFVVLTPQRYNQSGLVIACHVTHSLRNARLAVEIPASRGIGVEGFIQPDALHRLDVRARSGQLRGTLPWDLYLELCRYVQPLLFASTEDDR
jgi:mRNA interferase MazF